MDVQRNLEANVEKRTKDSFGPPLGNLDDINFLHLVTALKISVCLVQMCVLVILSTF
jgi:hypothetical protein